VSAEVNGELGELVAAPSQTVCFLARTYNDTIESHYRSSPDSARPRPVSGCSRSTPPFQPRPPAAARPGTAAPRGSKGAERGAAGRAREGESPFVETLVNLTLHSQLEKVELLNVDEMLELAAIILQTHCDDRCAYTQGEMTSQNIQPRYGRHFVGITWHNVWS